MDPTTKKKLHRGTYYYVRIDPKTDAITMEPMENHIHCENTVLFLEYRDIVKSMHQYTKTSMCN